MTAPLKVSCADCGVSEWLAGHVDLPAETDGQRLRRHGWRHGRCPVCVFLHHPDGDGIVTTGPKRIQLSRVKGWRKPEGAVVVSRPSKWGNPFRIHEHTEACYDEGSAAERNCPGPEGRETRAAAVKAFRHILVWPCSGDPDYPSEDEIRTELRGRVLACWCPLDQPCHADVLLELANAPDHPTSPAASVWDRPEGMRI